MTMITPVLALVIWTLIVWCWMYALRIPAMQKAKINPDDAIHPGSLSSLPSDVRVAADNYNHLHEQPTIFYALAIYSYLVGVGDALNMWLAWGYVAARVVHSLIQIVLKKVLLRFMVFAAGSVILMIIAARNLFALLLA
ncbi:MAPEG family protein [Hyphococcus sp.]|uniref:MAPEG family protein n=1 Tax=Hyphococcus sp. TaxID=2038636 RepID=UPI0035C730D3